MGTFITVLSCFLIFFAVCLIVLILLQSDKSGGMSNAIGGGAAETFYGKSKGRAKDALLSKLTTIISIVFVVIIAAIYVLQ
ncbi:MAG: preprotein translocase subunit SecG [Oscillospiraceae bacterium]|nr:preprotein translocase subunit SecG [Oscillospiraceae bacterium]